MKLTRAHRLHRLFVRRDAGPVELHLFFDERLMLEYVYSISSPDEFVECEHRSPRPVAEILNN
jgi:hypothetical protein